MLNDAVSLAIEIYSFSFHLILLAISQDPEVRAIPEEERDRRRESPREHVIRAIGNDTPMNDPFFYIPRTLLLRHKSPHRCST